MKINQNQRKSKENPWTSIEIKENQKKINQKPEKLKGQSIKTKENQRKINEYQWKDNHNSKTSKILNVTFTHKTNTF